MRSALIAFGGFAAGGVASFIAAVYWMSPQLEEHSKALSAMRVETQRFNDRHVDQQALNALCELKVVVGVVGIAVEDQRRAAPAFYVGEVFEKMIKDRLHEAEDRVGAQKDPKLIAELQWRREEAHRILEEIPMAYPRRSTAHSR